jgi:WD40 repeat protein
LSTHNEYFPFEGLIAYLHKNGYEIKEDSRDLLQQKWESLDKNSATKFKEFKQLITPIFTQNEAEAKHFSLLFDRFFYFPFAGFLDYLQQNGYIIGVHSYLCVQELLNHLDPNTEALDLKYILCPLFAQNPDEQEKFYYLFDSYFTLFPIIENKSFVEPNNENNQNLVNNQPIIERPTRFPLIAAGLLIVLVATFLAFTVWQNIKYYSEINNYAKTYDYSPSLWEKQQYIWNDLSDKSQICDSLDGEIIYTIIPDKKGYKARIKCKANKSIKPKIWSFLNKTYPNKDSIEVILPKTGSYPINLTISNKFGCSKQISGTVVALTDIEQEPLVAIFSCNIAGLEVQFIDSSLSKGSPISAWKWEFGDGKTSRENNPKHTYKMQGRYKVTLSVNNGKETNSVYKNINLEDRNAGRPDNMPELAELPPVMIGTALPTEVEHHTKGILKGLWLFFIIALPVMTFFFLIFRRKRRKFISQADKSIEPPYFWPINIETKTNFYDNALWNKVTTNLRKREEGEKNILDIPLSLQATLEAGGYPTLTYRASRRPVEYLFFIDRASFKDHQAIFFRQLAEKLAKEDIYIDIYFHNAHFQYFWRSFDERPIYLEELMARHPKHRLVIMGDGNGLVDAYSGELSPNAEPLIAAWKYRALMTSVSPSDWGLREVSIAKKFVLLPAKLSAFSILSERFDRRGNSSLQEWITGADDSVPNFDFDVTVSELRTYLGEQLFIWLCACATYPELHWDMTIFLGKFLSEELHATKIEKDKYPLLTEENLLKLVRLPFFRRGEIPDKTRMELLDFLEDKLEYKVRTAIIQVLEDNLPPEGTRVSDKLKVNLVLQKWQRDKTNIDADTQGKVEGLLERDEIQDYVVLEKLKQPPKMAMQILPEKDRLSISTFWRNALFRNGFPMLGMKSWIIGLASVLISLILLYIFIRSNPLQTLNFRGENGKKYDLQTRQDSLNYYAYNGITHYNDSLYGASLNDYSEIIQNLDAFNVRVFYNSGLANYALFRSQLTKDNIADSASLIKSIQDYEKALALLPQLKFCHATDSQVIKAPWNAADVAQYAGNNLNIAYQFIAGNGQKLETYSIGAKTVAPMASPITQDARIKSLDLSRNGSFVAVGTESFTGFVYAADYSNVIKLEGHKGAINVIRFSPDANYVATGSSDNTVIVWDRISGQEIHRLEWHKDRISDLNFSSDNDKIITCSSDETAIVWDRALGYPINILPKQDASLVGAGFLAHDRILYTVNVKGEVILWSNDGNIVNAFQADIEQVTRVVTSPDGSMIAIGGAGGKVKIFDLRGNLLWSQVMPTLVNKFLGAGSAVAGENTQITSLSFSKDGRKFLISSTSGNALYTFSAPEFTAKNIPSTKIITISDYNGALFTQNNDFSVNDDALKYYAIPYNLGVSYWEALQFKKAYQCFSLIPIDMNAKIAIPVLISRGLSAILAAEKSNDKAMFEIGIQDLYQVYKLDKTNGFANMSRQNAHKIVMTLDRMIANFPKEQDEIETICKLENAIYDNYCELKKRYDELGAANDNGYLPFRKKDKWGYLDKNMKEIIPAKYMKAGVVRGKMNLGLVEFDSPKGVVYGLVNMSGGVVYDAVGGRSTSEGWFAVRKNNRWGYLDSDYDERIAPTFEEAGIFQSGIAVVKKGKYGFILKTGFPLPGTGFNYDHAEPFDNRGMAKVVQYGVTFYIDKKGKRLSVTAGGGSSTIPMPTQISANPSLDVGDTKEAAKSVAIEGMSRFQDAKSGLFGFKDENAKVVVNPSYMNAMDFSEGLAAVCREVGSGNLKWGFINKTGLEVIPPIFDKVLQPFNNSLAVVQQKSDKPFSIDAKGNCVKDCPDIKAIPYTPQQYTPNMRDQDLDIPVIVKEGNGFVLKDKKGNLVINAVFQNRPNFFNGAAKVQIGGKWGFIFRDGRQITANYEDAGDFSEGLAPVKQNGKWGYINLKGDLLISPQFEEAGAVKNKTATVKLSGKTQIINVDDYMSGGYKDDFVKKGQKLLDKIKKNP